MSDAVERRCRNLGSCLGGLGVVEADALDEAAIARHARIGDDDVVEGAVLGSATGHANDVPFSSDFLPKLATGGVEKLNR